MVDDYSVAQTDDVGGYKRGSVGGFTHNPHCSKKARYFFLIRCPRPEEIV